MNTINLKKGLNISLKGRPNNNIEDCTDVSIIKIHPSRINGIKPKLSCKIDDEVKIGTELFFDKTDPTVKFVSNCSGKIVNIKLGKRRAIDEIKIENDKNNIHLNEYKTYTSSDINTFDENELIDIIKNSGYWSYIRQRPFSKIANSNKKPKSIFVSGFNTAPNALNLNLLLDDNKDALQSGINSLCRMAGLNFVNISINTNEHINLYRSLYNVNLHYVNGPHPSGNVGIQIHHIDPINVGDIVWYIDLQDLISIGIFLNKGLIDNKKIVALTGDGVENPTNYTVLKGTIINSLLKEEINTNQTRIISGDVLTGKQSDADDAIGYYDSQVSLLPEGNNREFLGWLMPGLNKFTNSNTYLSKLLKNKEWSLNTLVNGSYRSIIPFGYWEDVLPMDILPQYLIKSILAKDIEEMENLGIYECDEEDFALCSFVCQSKFPVKQIIRDGLKIMEEEA